MAAIPLAFWVGFSWQGVAWCVGLYYLRMLFCCIGYHRYFAHRTFQLSRVPQFILAFCAETTVQKGVLWWAAHHRRHHRYSDEPEDIHSVVQRGFWYAHVGWILSERWLETDTKRIADFARFPEIRWIDKHYWLPPTVLAVLLFIIGGPVAIVWGFVISTVVLWHGTFTINSLMHIIGRRRFDTSDNSKNSLVLAIVTCGEGWHNNHHRHQHAAAQGFYWWQIDFAYYVIKVFNWLGVIRNVVEPTPEILAEGRRKIAVPPPHIIHAESKAAASAAAAAAAITRQVSYNTV
ncbi:MAG: acyl-CoA desaturase [Planctomycetes bacterium]|nr:acyl-CoA desaturase [Planctomycetota bacterium]